MLLDKKVSGLINDLKNYVTTNTDLDTRLKITTIMSTAIMLEDNNMLKDSIIAAKQAGMTNDEICQINSIVLALRVKKFSETLDINKGNNTQRSQAKKCCQ